MNILIINQYAKLPDQPGGSRHYSIARELVRLGHNVTIVASSFHHGLRKELKLDHGETQKIEVVDGIQYLWVRTPRYRQNGWARLQNMVAFAHRVLQLKRNPHLQRPDVIVGSSPHLFGALAGSRLASSYNIPFVLEVRDLWPQSLIDIKGVSSRHPLVLLFSAIEKHLYRTASAIITLLPGAGPFIGKRGASSDNIYWIPNGVNLDLTPPARRPENGGEFTVIYAGTHGEANGLDQIIDAASILESKGASCKILLVGDGPIKPRLQRRAREKNIKNITFIEPVPKQNLYQLLERADAFLMVLQDSPVFRWGISPNKLFDYMAAARPIIFSVNTPLNPVLDAAAGVTVNPNSPHDLASAIEQLSLLSVDERWGMGKRAREYVETHHDLRKLAKRFEQVLSTAVEKQ